jgi:sugar porter (SP) family MFS transporter
VKGQLTGYVYAVGFIAALGGLLFGYDTGVVSGAQQFFAPEFHLTPTTQEIAVSSVLIGAVIGATIAGRHADWLGRRKALILLGVIFSVGAILTALAPSLWPFVACRILVGIAIGASSVVAPMYTTELAPPERRGQMVFLFQFFVTAGILTAYVVDLIFANIGLSWRWMFGVAVIPGLALVTGMICLGDTPRWFGSKGRWNEAIIEQARVSPGEEDEQVGAIRANLEQTAQSSWRELLHTGLRSALIAAVLLAVFQQFTGINTIIYYAPIVVGYTGFGSSSRTGSLEGAALVGVVNMLATIVAIFLVDRLGRRPLLLTGVAGMLITLTAMGFMFRIGPSRVGMLLLIALLLYIVCFAIGLGPVYWLMSAELFPTRLRGTGASAASTANWSANLLVTITFLTLITGIGPSTTFWIYAFFALLCLLYVWRTIPETKGRPLEKIEQYWRSGRQWEAAEQLAGDQSGGASRSDTQTGRTVRQARPRDDAPPDMPHAPA